jgi:EAL domain-containing protein (putative c-di-GMP-specific phosphodiesterase class I)
MNAETQKTTSQYIVLVDDETQVTEALAFALERADRTIIICSDLDSAEMAIAHYPVTHLVSDVQFTGQFGFEGLHFLSRIRRTAPGCRIALMTGFATDALRTTAVALGAAALLSKPFQLAELEAALALGGEPEGATEGRVLRVPGMEEILYGNFLRTAFQPIVRIKDEELHLFGYESLTRIEGSWLEEGASLVFEYAARRSALSELNLAAIRGAISAAAVIPGAPALFLNLDPQTFEHPQLLPVLLSESERAAIDLSRVVLEITERSAFGESMDDRIFRDLREVGVRFALDDHGSAYSHLSLINSIRPAFIKVSPTFGTAFETDETKRRIVTHVVALARDFGCETILEGVESEGTLRAAAEIGVDLMQGYHCGRPASAEACAAAGKVCAA